MAGAAYPLPQSSAALGQRVRSPSHPEPAEGHATMRNPNTLQRLRRAIASAALLAAGCAAPATDGPSPTGSPDLPPAPDGRAVAPVPLPTPAATPAATPASSLDPAANPRRVYAINVYRLRVPLGTVSGNADFWKRIDEQVVDPATYDLLFKNGVRVGAAPLEELPRLQGQIDANTAQRETVTADKAEQVEMEMRLNLPQQTLFTFEPAGADGRGVRAVGRSYDACDNVIYLSFRPVPRDSDAVELTMAPAVNSRRKRLNYTERGNEVEVAYVEPQTLYDLNLRVDLPLDHFLVVAPSAEVSEQTTVGAAFLTEDEPTERVEKVLVVVPVAVR